jgi:hypothetical protein
MSSQQGHSYRGLRMSEASQGERLAALYQAFNERNITKVLDAMAEDVDWPNGWEGGRLRGHAAVRSYWERQWSEIRVAVTPRAVRERSDGRLEVSVRQVVRSPLGAVLERSDVRHVYAFRGDLVHRMEVEAW